ncbi:NfeD family protein [Nodosilinea sp. PGN35]|uniref:NfeD family protein n=1 Tax=Nodosilinea sp. PGN35 TaxID=3020489 RepID=UPI0023B30CC6|nr:NfeD family protein [Nodosilinea sp. TSF1-S3]MDF0367963.1 NfeD family protein [Nodosilinea sp. TSF1-S3]
MSPFDPLSPEYFMIPAQGIVIEAIALGCNGQVKFKSSYWQAQLTQHGSGSSLQPGSLVDVVGRVGNTLLVKAR